MNKNIAILDETGTVLNIVHCHDSEQETPRLVAYTNDNPAHIGGDYVDGYFYPPQPFPSWTRSQGKWAAPVAEPTDDQAYAWDEDSGAWYPMGF